MIDISKWQYLAQSFASIEQAPYPYQSRIHLVRSLTTPSCQMYIKRDDELGCSITGSKVRKYRSLIAYFLKQKIEEVVLIGSAYSNHVLSLSQLLIENAIQPTLFLKGPPQHKSLGNFLFTQLFVDKNCIHWLSKEQWAEKSIVAKAYVDTYPNRRIFILPEGGSVTQALPGMLSLPLDILRNEQEHHLHFDHIFIDAGTGFTAAVLSLIFAWLNKKSHLHIITMADGYEKQLALCKQALEQLLEITCSWPTNTDVYKPICLAAFGSTNATLFQTIQSIARSEGFLLDPIYSAKLFQTTQALIQCKSLQGQGLLIHSGGTWSLSGFQDRFNC